MKRFRLISAILIALFLCVPLSAKESHIAADFTLQDLEQNKITLSNYRGKQPVLLFLWATWCPFCLEELKTLNIKYKELARDGIELLAIDIGEPLHKVEKFIKKQALVFKVILDEDRASAFAYNIVGVPTFILINKKGEIVFQNHYFPKHYKNLLSE